MIKLTFRNNNAILCTKAQSYYKMTWVMQNLNDSKCVLTGSLLVCIYTHICCRFDGKVNGQQWSLQHFHHSREQGYLYTSQRMFDSLQDRVARNLSYLPGSRYRPVAD